MPGFDHPSDPIGSEPVAGAPEARAAWHEAFAALGPVDGPNVRGMPDGTLPHLRDTSPVETAWAILQPPKPDISPSPQILQRVTDRDADWEAAD